MMRPAHTTGCSPLISVCSASSSSTSARRGPVARSSTSATGRSDGDIAGCLAAMVLSCLVGGRRFCSGGRMPAVVITNGPLYTAADLTELPQLCRRQRLEHQSGDGVGVTGGGLVELLAALFSEDGQGVAAVRWVRRSSHPSPLFQA